MWCVEHENTLLSISVSWQEEIMLTGESGREVDFPDSRITPDSSTKNILLSSSG